LLAVGLVGAAVPAIAGELDNDPDNNRLNVRMSLRCHSDHSATLRWTSIAPREAVSMTAFWYDMTSDPNLDNPRPASKSAQVAAVHRSGGSASGSFRIKRSSNGHRILIFVDAWSASGGRGQQVYGLGRNIDTVGC
jgi:hypothetical protein